MAEGVLAVDSRSVPPHFLRACSLLLFCLTFGPFLNVTAPVQAQTVPLSYIYDDLGRLRAVVDAQSDTAIYEYDAVGNLISITRQSSSLVSIIEFSPKSGPVGTTVTIQGTGFGTTAGENTVAFNGALAAVNSAAATQIVAIVPSEATTGPISVTTPTGSAISSAVFTVTGPLGTPTITNFSPTIGTPGTAVTITGTNFQTTAANNNVFFNIERAGVNSATTTTIGASVPTGTGSGRISVSTLSGKAISSADFFIPPAPYTAADVAFTGRMTIGGSSQTVTINTANKIALVVFDGTAGQRISLLINSATTCGNLSILKPDGTTLVYAGNLCSGGFVDVQTLPVTGTYTVFIDPPGTNTGSFTLTLYLPVDIIGTIIPGGSSVTVNITTPGQNARLTFSGTAGQRVSLYVNSSTLPNGCSFTGLYIFKPDGTTLVSTLPCSGRFIEPLTLPVTGTYTLFLDPYGSNTGNVTVTLYNVPPDITGTITVGGPSVTVTITTPGQNASLTFEGTAGQRVSLLVNSASSCANFTILKPDGTTLIAAFGLLCSGGFIDTQTLPVTGTYTIFINPPTTNTGSFTLTLYSVVDITGTIIPGGPSVTVNFTIPGQNASLTFSGTAGQRMSLYVNSSTLPNGCSFTGLYILKPDGGSLASNLPCSGKFIEPVALPVTGTYTVFIDPYGSNTGNVTVTLYNVPPDITGTIAVGGPSVTVTITTPGQNGSLTFSGTAGQQVTVRNTGNSISGGGGSCVLVKLLKPDNTQLTSSASCSASFNLAAQTLPTTGTYTVSVDPVTISTGSLTVSVTSP